MLESKSSSDVTHPRLNFRGRASARLSTACLSAVLSCARAIAQTELPPSDVQGPEDEVSVTAERQNALETQSVRFSATPNAGPHLSHTTAVLGVGAVVVPVYAGSNKYEVVPFPYVDIRGLLNDRVFVSDVGGVGVKILNRGPVLAGVSLNYGGGRKSSDDPHLKGLPDIKATARVSGYVALELRPVTLEANVQQRTGSGGGMTASFGASYNFSPWPQLHLSLGANVAWANAAEQKILFGVTPADAAVASAEGNPLPAYTPGSGLTGASLAGAGVYQLNRHWGIVGRVSFSDLVGSSVKDSPLTQRTSGLSSFGLGLAYMF